MRKEQVLSYILVVLLTTPVWAEEVKAQTKVVESVALEQEFMYDTHGRRDPFWRLVNPSGAIVNYDRELSASDLALEGIMSEKDGRNVAIINGQIVKVNEVLLGAYRVIAIDPGVVVLQKDQEIIKLKLKKED